MTPVIAIVGRPNVGKSTLFNRLVGSRQALVHDRPGVTRDRNYGEAVVEGREVILIDTGGLDVEPDDDLFDAIRSQAEAAMSEADVVLFLVDRISGITPADRLCADLLRRRFSGVGGEGAQRSLAEGGAPPSAKTREQSKVLLVVNKCDAHSHDIEANEFWELGISPMVTMSAEHGRGLGELWDEVERLLPALDESGEDDASEEEDDLSPDETTHEIRVAVVGRPNIGKSTLVNRLIGEERHVVHDMPGTTMDSIDSVIEVDGRTWRFVDTAGVRRRARIDDRLETFATSRAIRTIERCHVSLLMIDGVEGLTHQDARLAALIADRGRACVVLINRWDLVRDLPERDAKTLKAELAKTLPHLEWAPVLFISALTGKGCHRILPTVEQVYEQFDKRITTAELNRFLEMAVRSHSVPQKHHRPVRLNYITQARVRPPSFVVWTNSPDAVKPPYQRYLENRLRDAYGFEGTPLRLSFRKKRKPGEPSAS